MALWSCIPLATKENWPTKTEIVWRASDSTPTLMVSGVHFHSTLAGQGAQYVIPAGLLERTETHSWQT